MESTFLSLLQPKERDGFVQYSKCVKDLAGLFKCEREASVNKKMPESKRKQQQLTAKMIFGVGDVPGDVKNKTCRLVPSNLGAFFSLRNETAKPPI